MKNIISILFIVFSVSNLFSQNTVVVVDSECLGYDVVVDNSTQTRLDDCKHDVPNIVDGSTYSLQAVSDPSASLFNISTIDLVLIQRGMLFGFESDLDAYLADYDQDGAVSTSDLVALRADILGVTQSVPEHHVFPVNQTFPTIDPFDIQVDLSQLNFTTDDFQNGEMAINVFKIGNLR